MEKLELHLTVSRQIKGSVPHGAIKRERFAVEVLVNAVKIRRAQDVGVWDILLQILFRLQFVPPVIAPDSIVTAGLFFCEGLGIRFGINGTGADKDVIGKTHAGIEHRLDMLACVGGDIENDIKESAPQYIS